MERGPFRGVVVDHLIFVAGSARAFFGDEIFYPVVAVFFDAPVPTQFEIVEGLLGDEVAGLDAGDFLEDAVFDAPTGADGGAGGFAVETPTGERLTVEERTPAGGFFLGSEGWRRGCGGAERETKHEGGDKKREGANGVFHFGVRGRLINERAG